METDEQRGGAVLASASAESTRGDSAPVVTGNADRAVVRKIGWIPSHDTGRSRPHAPLRPVGERRNGESAIIGSSPAARVLRETIQLFADEIEPVIITGETGTGKELIAKELHRLGGRAGGPFAAINAGGIPDGLATSQLFGHAKGAFTGAIADYEGVFAAAHGGVLFLDEIGDMAPPVQVQLLRVLDNGVVQKLGARTSRAMDFRLISATNVDLADTVKARSFRLDLFHRISVLEIAAPPLRDRGDDVIELAEHFIAAHPKAAYRGARLTPNAADRLRTLPFPGNIRELKNVLSSAIIRARGGKILAEHLPESATAASGAARLDLGDAKELMARLVVLKALKSSGGNVSKAAEITGRSRSTIHTALQQMGGADLAAEYETLRARLKAFLDQ